MHLTKPAGIDGLTQAVASLARLGLDIFDARRDPAGLTQAVASLARLGSIPTGPEPS